MKPENRQSGQALVGTLVILVLVFAMAGAVALAATSLLHRQSSHRTAIAEDLRASDASTAAVAYVLQAHPTCPGITAAGSPPPPPRFSSSLPGPYTSSAFCLRVDEVATPTLTAPVTGMVLNWVRVPGSTSSGSKLCGSALVPSSTKIRAWLFFSALAGLTAAWVDGQATCDPNAAKRECPFTPGLGQPVVQAAMDCDLADVPSQAYLHVLNPLSSPTVVRFVANGNQQQSGDQPPTPDTTGSIYELVAGTGLSAWPQFEEGAVFVSRDRLTTTLLSEGAL
jgi:hypothetical protein